MWSGGYCSSANMARGLSDGRSPLSLIIRAVMICRQEAAGAMDCGRGPGELRGFVMIGVHSLRYVHKGVLSSFHSSFQSRPCYHCDNAVYPPYCKVEVNYFL